MSIYGETPRQVKTHNTTSLYGQGVKYPPAPGTTAYDNLVSVSNDFVIVKPVGCQSCSGNKGKAINIPISMVWEAILERTVPPAQLAINHAERLKRDLSLKHTAPVGLINAKIVEGAGLLALQRKWVPFNPYTKAARTRQNDAQFPNYAASIKGRLGPAAAAVVQPAPQPLKVPQPLKPVQTPAVIKPEVSVTPTPVRPINTPKPQPTSVAARPATPQPAASMAEPVKVPEVDTSPLPPPSQVEPMPAKAAKVKDILRYLTANPGKAAAIRDQEMTRNAPRKTVMAKVEQILGGNAAPKEEE